MPQNVISTLIKLLVASLVVGLVLSFFDIDPKNLIANFGKTIQDIFSLAADWISKAVKYVLLGAIIVLPIWAIVFGFGKLTGKKKTGA